MISPNKLFILLLLLNFQTFFGQTKQENPKIKISGKIIEKSSALPLEYATITFIGFNSNQVISGGISDSKGNFSIDIQPGKYNVKFEFICWSECVYAHSTKEMSNAFTNRIGCRR